MGVERTANSTPPHPVWPISAKYVRLQPGPMKLDHLISRRLFLILTGGSALTPLAARAAHGVPAALDHFILGCNDLDRGIDFVEQHTGVRAAPGGVHPGRGTRNALLSLGERRYLEIMAPDPAQNVAPQISRLAKLREPRIVGWAAHPGDLTQFSAHLREAGLQFDGPRAGSRQRPDGKLLRWQTITLSDNPDGLLPFFIEWSPDSVHPSVDSPQGCRLRHFGVATPQVGALKKLADLLQLVVSVSLADKPALHAAMAGSKGDLSVTS